MAQRTDNFDIGALRLSSGEGRRLELEVPVDGFDFGGQRYAIPGEQVDAVVDVSHTTNGYSLRLRFDHGARGPVHALPRAGRARTSRSTRARSISPAAARSSARPTSTATSST